MLLASHTNHTIYLKTTAAELVEAFAVNPEPAIITQNSEAKMLALSINEYGSQQETLVLLKLLALGSREIKEGKFSDAHAFLGEMDD